MINEEEINRVMSSIDSLCKIVLINFNRYECSSAVEVYSEIVDFYQKFGTSINDEKATEEIREYIIYKLKWINQHRDVDEYYRSTLIDVFNRYVG